MAIQKHKKRKTIIMPNSNKATNVLEGGLEIFKILRNRKRLKHPSQNPDISSNTSKDVETNWKFDPPVYRQRYCKVYETLVQEKWRNSVEKLVDFGCAEFSLFHYIRRLNLAEIVFIDIDEALMVQNLGLLEPLIIDQLRRRSTPLEVTVLRGSIADPDYRLRKTDVVTAIEIIEHLYPDTLDALPYNIFSFIRPKLVIMSTPNADFNVVFNKMDQFRHPDHKFEWTRQQFEDWCHNITQRFVDYTVEFSGLGDAPEYLNTIGRCSQVAVFTRKDVSCESYISATYAKHCHCDKASPCKGPATESKLLCNCLCGLCLPDFSVGVCTYLSCNVNESEAYRPMKTDKALSDTDLTHFSLYNTRMNRTCDGPNEVNPSYNIFYKLIERIDYPYEVDSRSETEKLMTTLTYRIQTFSRINSRFYVEDRERCEIPIWDIMYGDIDITAEEVGKLLIQAGYQLEQCISSETGESEYCIISVPQEMEEISNTSEDTDGYSSKSSDCNESSKFQPNPGNLSDWDEIAYVPQEVVPAPGQDASSSREPPTDTNVSNPDPLVDSGYQKSPSPLEPSQPLPQLHLQDNPEPVETDIFEDIVSTPNMGSDDNKLHLKKSPAKERYAGALVPMADNPKPKLVDLNKINELDRFHNMSSAKTFMSSYLKPQNEFKKSVLKDLPLAGTSSSWRRPRKFKDKEKKTDIKHEPKEPTALDDAKSLTNCILQNSLNQVEVDDEDVGPKSELIHNLSPLQEPVDVIDAGPLEVEPPLNPDVEDVAPAGAVENGDLANNNRDNEGNNLEENDIIELDIDEGIDLNDNLEELVPLLADNAVLIENNNGGIVEAVPEELVEELPEDVVERMEPENSDASALELETEISVGEASREVLFDENSEQDLLEDFDIPPQPNHDLFSVLDLGTSVVLVGIRPITSNNAHVGQVPIAGSQIVPEANQDPPGSHDEPHFYCQGDGVGVHPSVMAVEVDEADDADNDTTTEESSSNNTVDYAEVDPGPSEMLDMSSLPEESSQATSVVDALKTAECSWNDRTSNNDMTIDPSSYPVPEDAHISNHIDEGTSLINEILRAAVEEVNRRTQSTSTSQDTSRVDGKHDSQSSLLKRCEDASNKLQQSHQEPLLPKTSANAFEGEACFSGTPNSTDKNSQFFSMSGSQENSDSLCMDVIYSNSNSEEASHVIESHFESDQGNDNAKVLKSETVDEANSFNGSDHSEYFESKTEEF